MRILDPGLQYVGQEVNSKCGNYLSLHLREKIVSETQACEAKQDMTFLISDLLKPFFTILKVFKKYFKIFSEH